MTFGTLGEEDDVLPHLQQSQQSSHYPQMCVQNCKVGQI